MHRIIKTSDSNLMTHTGHYNVVRLLIENGANVNAVNGEMETAFILTIRSGIYTFI